MAKNTVRVNVVGDASSLKKSMGEAQGATDKLGKGMSTFAKIAVAALAVKALGAVKDFVGDSKRAFVDLNESLNAVEVIYGKSAEGIKQIGRESATSMGLSNAAFNSFAVSIANFAKEIAGEGGDVVGVVRTMTGRVADFASVMNLEVDVAFEKFQSGLAGQSRPLREFGIDVSDARVQSFALANGIGEVGRELTEGEKIQARYGTIMEQTANVQGDFANTSDELANATRIANAQMENSKAIIGQALKGAYQAALPLQVELAKGAARLAISFMELTDQITETEAETLRLNEATDGSVESLKEMVDVLGFSTEKVKNHRTGRMEDIQVQKDFEDVLKSVNRQLIAQPDFMDLTGKSAQELRHEAQQLSREYGFTREQTEEFIDMLLFQQRVQSDTKSGDAWLDSLLNQGEAVGELTESLDENIETIEEQTAAIVKAARTAENLASDTYGLMDATNAVKEAQEAYNAALAKHGPTAEETLSAARDLVIANGNLNTKWTEFVTTFGPNARGEFRKLLTDMGLNEDMIEAILDDLQALDTFKIGNKTFKIDAKGGVGFGSGGVGFPSFHSGGVFHAPPGQREGLALLRDQETVLTPGQANGSSGGGSLGGQINVTVYGSVLTPTDLVDAIHEGLLQKQKRNGGLGLAG